MGARFLSLHHVLALILILSVTVSFVSCARNFVIVWEDDDIKKDNHDFGTNGEEYSTSNDAEDRKGLLGFMDPQEPTLEWDEFGDTEETTEDALDPGSWIHVSEHEDRDERPDEVSAFLYLS
jgi:hypothetical protein